ncbi:hypothetical protein AXF42_Ash009389 [Apostasia shenzhenica]|uniref:Uncharacterized protein n=1 Tax=Apostasia shenzhenica TaxID=1088818 RepID=A0A2I0B3X6_9ASPA|nr:hypothetical protein AXF42_Ash009389 [Apostasia shenzhenica]
MKSLFPTMAKMKIRTVAEKLFSCLPPPATDHLDSDLESFNAILFDCTALVVSSLDIDGKRVHSISSNSFVDITDAFLLVHRHAADTLLKLRYETPSDRPSRPSFSSVLNLFEAIEHCLAKSKEALAVLAKTLAEVDFSDPNRSATDTHDKMKPFEDAGRESTEKFAGEVKSVAEQQIRELRELDQRRPKVKEEKKAFDVVFGLSSMVLIVAIAIIWVMAPALKAAKAGEAPEVWEAGELPAVMEAALKLLCDPSEESGSQRNSFAICELDELRALALKLSFLLQEVSEEGVNDVAGLLEEDKKFVRETVEEMTIKSERFNLKIAKLEQHLIDSRRKFSEVEAKISEAWK